MPPEAIKHLLRPEHSNGRVRLLIVIAMVLGTIRLIEQAPLQSANDRSRWATVWSLVERNTFTIDEVRQYRGWDTIDKVKIGEHFYSSKPPLFSTMVAGGYWVIRNTLGWKIDPAKLETVTPVSHLLLFLINIVPTAFALGSFAKLLWRHGEISFTRNFVIAAACFGTLWSAYLPSLNNHTPAICCVVFALRAAVVSVPASLTMQRLAFAGFMSGLAVTFELPALAFLCGLFIILLKYMPKRTLIAFVPMALVPLAAFLIANKAAIGDWVPVYAAHSQAADNPYHYIENGVPSYWLEPKGLDRSVDPVYTYLFHCTFGHHGLFSLTPIFLLSIIGLMRFRKWQYSAFAPFYMLGALLSVVVLAFYLMQTKSYNYGGVSVGLRWMIWLIPFWLLMMIPAVDLISVNRLGQAVLMVFMAPSVFSAWHPFDAPWKQPWIYNVLARAGRLGQYSDPPPKYEVPRRTWFSQLPAGDQPDADYWVELSGTGVDGTAITLRMADGGPVVAGDQKGRRVDLLWNQGRATESARSFVIDATAFHPEGGTSLLLWPGGEPSQAELLAALEQVCGVPVGIHPETRLPLLPNYNLATRRYQFLGVRTDAFQCDIGVAWGLRQTTAPGIPTISIRSETWNTAELPFGVGLWELQTRDGTSGAMLAVRRLSAVRAGKILDKPTPPSSD